nr:hypothetical protein [Planctomycetota bacterium]
MLWENDCLTVSGSFDPNAHCEMIECQPTCDGDVNGDGVVNVADILLVIAAWGACF